MKKNRANSFILSLVLTFVLFSGIPCTSEAQSPGHLQSFDLSPLQQGEFLLLAKKPEDALKVFKDLWQKETQNSYAVRGIVRSHQALDTLPEAIALLDQYIKSHPQSSSASYGLGYAFYLQGRIEESRIILDQAVSLKRKNVLALNNLGAVLVELKEYASAIEKVKEAIDLAPKELMFYRNLQMIYIDSGKPDTFEEEYRKLLAEESSSKAKGYGLILAQQLRQKSFKLYSEGKINEAVSTIVDMLNLYREVNHKPGIVAGLFSLAVLYEEQGKIELALQKYREVLKINPQHIQAREKLRSLSEKKD